MRLLRNIHGDFVSENLVILVSTFKSCMYINYNINIYFNNKCMRYFKKCVSFLCTHRILDHSLNKMCAITVSKNKLLLRINY